jgi:hypothetical protein
MNIRKVLAAAILALGVLTGRAEAATLTVCATGCTYTNSQLQTALNAAVAGDSVLLQAGFTYVGNYTLRRHGGASNVTVRTGVTSTGSIISLGSFPAAGVRMTNALATTYNLAILKSNINNEPALRTADPSAGVATQYWAIKWIKIIAGGTGGAFYGGGDLLRLGDDSNSTVTQISEIPSNFTLEQFVLAGDPVKGQFRGLSLHANNVTVKDCTIQDIKSSAEGQGVFINSSEGPYTIDNCYIVGNGENVIAGGASGAARPSVTVSASPAPTTTSATLSTFNGLRVGKHLTFDVTLGGTTVEQLTKIVSCGTSVDGALCTSANVTFTALDAAPNVGGDVDWGPSPANLTFTRNLVEKPLDWRNPILGTPQNPTASGVAGGTLTAGNYSYRVVARMGIANAATARSTASTEVAATLSETGSVRITWSPVTNAETYYIYGRSSGAQNVRFSVTTSACSATVCTYTDTGSAGTTESVPTSTGTTWFIKNIFELKHMDTALVEGNVFSGSWADGQTGYAIVFTVSNTSNGNDSTILRRVTFRNNIVKNAAGGVQIGGRDLSSGVPSARTEDLTFHNNLFFDMGTSFGASNRVFIITTRAHANIYPAGTPMGPRNITLTHNTFAQTSGNAFIWFDLFKTIEQAVENMTVSNNIFYKLGYGMTGGNSCGEGDFTNASTTGCWTMHVTGTRSWLKNLGADITCANYPGGSAQNFCPSTATLRNEFTDFDNDNYLLKSTSPYHNAGSDGTDLGANISAIAAFTNVALSGDATGGTPVVPPTITTSSLPSGNTSTNYSATMTATGCSGSCSWSVSGQPTGVTMSAAGVFDGRPTVPGTYTVVVTATSAGVSSNATYTVTITSPTPVPDEPTTPRALRPSMWNGNYCRSFVGPTEPEENSTTALKVCDTWWDTTNIAFKVLQATGPVKVWTTVSGGGSSTQPASVMVNSSTVNITPGNSGAYAEIVGSARRRFVYDTQNFTQISIVLTHQASDLSAVTFKVEYWNGSAWADAGVSQTGGTGDTLIQSAYGTLASGARAANTIFRVVAAHTGTGSATSINNLQILFR